MVSYIVILVCGAQVKPSLCPLRMLIW